MRLPLMKTMISASKTKANEKKYDKNEEKT